MGNFIATYFWETEEQDPHKQVMVDSTTIKELILSQNSIENPLGCRRRDESSTNLSHLKIHRLRNYQMDGENHIECSQMYCCEDTEEVDLCDTILQEAWIDHPHKSSTNLSHLKIHRLRNYQMDGENHIECSQMYCCEDTEEVDLCDTNLQEAWPGHSHELPSDWNTQKEMNNCREESHDVMDKYFQKYDYQVIFQHAMIIFLVTQFFLDQNFFYKITNLMSDLHNPEEPQFTRKTFSYNNNNNNNI